MVRRATTIAALLVLGACRVPAPRPQPQPEPPHLVDIAVTAIDRATGAPINRAICDDGDRRVVTNADGWASLGQWPAGDRFVQCAALNYADNLTTYTVVWPTAQIVRVPLTALHVDPTTFSLGELAAIRGAMWPRAGLCPESLVLPLGPQPNEPNNIIATAYFDNYTPIQQEAIARCFQALGWTHVVVGGLVDEWAYHGQYIGHDYTSPAAFERFLDEHQWFYDHGLKPITFIHQDGATFEQTEQLVKQLIVDNPRAQRLIRIVVMSGWEPAGYTWSSCTWAKYVRLARDALPHALNLIHTISDIDAPVGTDALCNDDDHVWNPGGNGAGWARVIAEGLHGWLIQNGPYHVGPGADGALAREFAAQFKADGDGATFHSAAWHFAGNAGWPSSSAWGANIPICLYNAENTAYEAYWYNRPTAADRNAWGDLAVTAGACGYLDGGTVAVPVLR